MLVNLQQQNAQIQQQLLQLLNGPPPPVAIPANPVPLLAQGGAQAVAAGGGELRVSAVVMK